MLKRHGIVQSMSRKGGCYDIHEARPAGLQKHPAPIEELPSLGNGPSFGNRPDAGHLLPPAGRAHKLPVVSDVQREASGIGDDCLIRHQEVGLDALEPYDTPLIALGSDDLLERPDDCEVKVVGSSLTIPAVSRWQVGSHSSAECRLLPAAFALLAPLRAYRSMWSGLW